MNNEYLVMRSPLRNKYSLIIVHYSFNYAQYIALAHN